MGELHPPLIWMGQKAGLVEDRRYQRWTPAQVRAMRNGVYDWSKHVERPA